MKLFRDQPDHDHWRVPLTGREQAAVFWGLAAVFFLLAVVQWSDPSAPPFTGRWGWLLGWAHGHMGLHGPTAVFAGVGAVLSVIGCVLWSRQTK